MHEEKLPLGCATVAIIPLRGGSKSIPRKNLKLLAGRPLFHWTALAACEAEAIDKVYIATDDPEIAESALALGHPKIQIFVRSAETATDTATTESLLLEFADQVVFKHIVLIQATSPLLRAEDLNSGLAKFRLLAADSLLSVVCQKRFFWSEGDGGFATPANYDPSRRPRRQDFDGQLVENGAFYICGREGLLDSGSRLYGRIAVYEMPEETYVELDEPLDWDLVERLMEQRNEEMVDKTSLNDDPQSRDCDTLASLAGRAAKIRLVLTDVDGVLTDAGMYYGESGEELKKFNTRDAVGLRLLREAGIKVGIITSEDTQIVARRANKMGVDFLIQGAKDKSEELDVLLSKTGLDASEVAFIGDDINDLSILARVGLAATPADGQSPLRSHIHYVCSVGGGGGCVREFSDLILKARV